MNQREGFLKAIREGCCEANWLVFADWLEEHGEEGLAHWFRQPHPPAETELLSPQGDGYGYGSGDGSGYGEGSGYRVGDGTSSGYCSSDGSGAGDGFGSNYGEGDAFGKGVGYGFDPQPPQDPAPTAGRNQLIFLPYGWVICGYVAEQVGPFQFRVENASVICHRSGTSWDELAEGSGRDQAVFRKWGTVTIGPNFALTREWLGDLP